MPREFGRAQRLAEQVQRELGTSLLFEIQDPRLSGVTISGVEVTRDLSIAKVYFALPAGEDIAGALSALERAKGFLRTKIAKEIRIRAVPELRFVYDDALDESDRIETLLRESRERAGPAR
ncbi:MAG: 30S ribosome-binding factor RbfA [Gammaproteobacteria bacterium]|nr:30S ribosome-binding factor RbfA [Gammaproteobacteria bacterium]